MSIAEHQNVPAAWYPDRANPEQLRWWDGADWTDEVRPVMAAVPAPSAQPVAVIEPAEIEPEAPKFQAPPLLQTRRGINVVAQPAQGFGHASPEQLRAWAPPHAEDRSEIPTPVSDFPSEWRRGARRSEPLAVTNQTDALAEWLDNPSVDLLAEPAEYTTQEPDTYFTVEPAAIVRDELPADYFSAEPVADRGAYGVTPYVAEEQNPVVSEPAWQPPLEETPSPSWQQPLAADLAPVTDSAERWPEPFSAQPFYQEQFEAPAIDPQWPAPSFESAAIAPELEAPSTTLPGHTTLTRRQLRAMVGPLTTGVAATS